VERQILEALQARRCRSARGRSMLFGVRYSPEESVAAQTQECMSN
jgi:hypothetical protein